ncbi:unnamed protein product [marine sediment metagenome]|uniref:Uncharacterized protein n=1 Tax=marine sediment metagenome TaxID=412755 RepID=X0UR48_9ZZZZ
MFGIATKKDVWEARRDILNEVYAVRDGEIKVIRGLCPHKVLTEYAGAMTQEKTFPPNFRCKLCGEFFDSKPKKSKISRMKEVLSNK